MVVSLYSLKSVRSILVYALILLGTFIIYRWKMEFIISSIGISILIVALGTPLLWSFLSSLHTVIFKDQKIVIQTEIPFLRPIKLEPQNVKEVSVIAGRRHHNTLRIVMYDHTVKLFTIDPLNLKQRERLNEFFQLSKVAFKTHIH
ncbi:MAG: hypothetical protein OCD01_15140 [Fibrobacterales bacterium]